MIKNPGNKRSLTVALHRELLQLLTRISQTEEFTELRSGTFGRQELGLGQALEAGSDENDEMAALQLSLKSIEKLAELLQITGGWLERLENIRATVAAETRELGRLRQEIEVTEISLEQEAKDYQQQHQKLEAEIQAAHECLRQERECRDNEEREHTEKLKRQREESERLMALDQERARQAFMKEMRAREQANSEKQDALEKEFERREAALRNEEQEWTQAMKEFEKLSLKLSKRSGAKIGVHSALAEHEADNQSLTSNMVSRSAAEQERGDTQPVPLGPEPMIMEGKSLGSEEEVADAIPALGEEIVTHSAEEAVVPEFVEILPPLTEELRASWNPADALSRSSSVGASKDVEETIDDLLSRQKVAGAMQSREPAPPSERESDVLNFGAIVDSIFAEVPGQEQAEAASINHARSPSSSREESAFRIRTAASPHQQSLPVNETEEPPGTLLGKLKRKVRALGSSSSKND